MSELKANFKIEKREPIQATFRISLTPEKVSQLENDLDFVRREEVNLPDVDFDEFATKQEVENISTQKVDVSDFETTIEDINIALETKQPKGDYASPNDIPDVSNLASKTEVMQMIASIPQFALKVVNELPVIGEKMTLYLVPKEGSDNDIYNEYVWIEELQKFEHLPHLRQWPAAAARNIRFPGIPVSC